MISYSKTTETYYRDGNEITKKEYEHIRELINNKPIAPTGYGYKLTDALEWELYELPTEEEVEEIATDEDYLQALERLGVNND